MKRLHGRKADAIKRLKIYNLFGVRSIVVGSGEHASGLKTGAFRWV